MPTTLYLNNRSLVRKCHFSLPMPLILHEFSLVYFSVLKSYFPMPVIHIFFPLTNIMQTVYCSERTVSVCLSFGTYFTKIGGAVVPNNSLKADRGPITKVSFDEEPLTVFILTNFSTATMEIAIFPLA